MINTHAERDREREKECEKVGAVLPEGTVITENAGLHYSIGKQIGKGGFARCYEAVCVESGEAYACKCVPQTSLLKPSTKKKLMFEVRVHRQMKHKNVVKFYSCFEDTNYVYIILELCRQKTLMELMKQRKRITEPEVRYWISQIIEGTMYLHQNLVIHRDLKLANILISDMTIKIGDFGLCAKLETKDEKKKSVCGTPNYIAPEILVSSSDQQSQSADNQGHSFEVDVWSIGVIIYTLLFGRPPFETGNVKETYKRIKAVEYRFPSSIDDVSDEAKSLIRSILNKDPKQRPSLSSALQSPFFRHTIPHSLPQHALLFAPTFLPSPTKITSPSRTKKEEAIDEFVISEQNPNNKVQKLCKNNATPKRKTQIKIANANTNVGNKENKDVVRLLSALTIDDVKNEQERFNFDINDFYSIEPLEHKEKYVSDSVYYLRSFIIKQLTKEIIREDPRSVLLAPARYVPKRPAMMRTTVINFLDISSRYGLGYVLSNGVCGAHFNDLTIMTCKNNKALYLPCSTVPTVHSLEAIPTSHDVAKKLQIIAHFQKQLFELSKHSVIISADQKVPLEEIEKWSQINYSSGLPNTEEATCVLRWKKGDNYYVFLTSEGLLQFSFLNTSHLLILFSMADGTVFIRENERVYLNCAFSDIPKAIGALTRFAQPALISRLAVCLDAIPGFLSSSFADSENAEDGHLIGCDDYRDCGTCGDAVAPIIRRIEEELKHVRLQQQQLQQRK